MQLRIIPGGHVPDLKTAEKGNAFLASAFRSHIDTQAAMERDAAEEATEHNISYEERLKLSATDGRPPPRDFDRFKVTVVTYAAKQWTLRGNGCPFYTNLVDIRETLELSLCQAQREEYKPIVCRQYSWVIMVDCQYCFSQTVHPNEFATKKATSERVNFPKLLLSEIIPSVLHGMHVFRMSFPKEWLAPEQRRIAGPNNQRNQQQEGWQSSQVSNQRAQGYGD